MIEAELWGATLVASAATSLSQNHIESYAAEIAARGGIVLNKSWLAEGRAADVIFTGAYPDACPGFAAFPFDVIVQRQQGRQKKLLVADMESTIIEQEMLDELAIEIGIGEKVAAITRRAMNGELDFTAALAERVGLLKGQPVALLDKVAERMTLMPGAQNLVAAMKRTSAHCWLVSGGFTFFVKIIADRLGFDRFYANRLEVGNGVITGEIVPPILDKNAKKTLLEKACAEYGLSLSECLTVGDGANDVPMLQACGQGGGLGIAYRAKPAVREVIHNQINHGDLSALIYAQGMDVDIENASQRKL
jgi:phosphoserine phosphatase